MVVPASTQIDSHSLSATRGTTTRARAGLDDTAQPPLTSGFGAVMEQERDIQSSTERHLGRDNGPSSAAIDCILRQQHTRLGANIALLEQRYETLPHPTRFQALNTKHASLARRAATATEYVGFLPSLVAQHRNLLGKIHVLITQRPDGQRGELILSEIARNHEEMACMLMALMGEEESVRDLIPTPVTAFAPGAPNPATSEANWKNEGGASPVGRWPA